MLAFDMSALLLEDRRLCQQVDDKKRRCDHAHGTGYHTTISNVSVHAMLPIGLDPHRDNLATGSPAMYSNVLSGSFCRKGSKLWTNVAYANNGTGHLRGIYASGMGPGAMRERKHAAFAALRASYAQIKAGWGGYAPFDAWFNGELNNAHLASIATYYTCVPGFARELKAVNGDINAFYRRVRELTALDDQKRAAIVCDSTGA